MSLLQRNLYRRSEYSVLIIMKYYYLGLLVLLNYCNVLNADISNKELLDVHLISSSSGDGYIYPIPEECSSKLGTVAEYAARFTNCTIIYSRPLRLCEKCIDQYMNFHKNYQDLMNTVVNETSCKSIYISRDRLDAVLEYHDSLFSIWDKGHCNACYNWSESVPVLSNETKHFYILYNDTVSCLKKYININTNNTEVCEKCMQEYLELDKYYKTLSADTIGVDSICMDIVDSMNATRSFWSKTLNCCKIRRTPEIIFLCCTAIISLLPLFYYITLRYCGPIRDFPNVLKQSRFKQTILRSINRRIN